MSEAAYADVQTKGFHADPEVNLQGYTYEKLLEYWGAIYTLGLLAGVVGSENEQEAAKQAIFDAMEGIGEAAVGYLDAAAIALDDYTPPGVGAFAMRKIQGGLSGVQGISEFFGYDAGLEDDIASLDRRIRDSVAVDVRQISQIKKMAKATVSEITKSTDYLDDYTPNTSSEDQVIQRTQQLKDKRDAQVHEALKNAWNAIKNTALERYNQFLSDWEVGGLEFAIGTLGIDAAFLAIEIAIGVAAGIVTGGAGAVALKVTLIIGKRIGKAARSVAVVIKRVGSTNPKSGRIPLDEYKVVNHAKSKNGFGDDLGGAPNSIKDPKKDTGGPDGTKDRDKQEDDDQKGKPKSTTKTHTHGKNENNITYDAETGRPIGAKGTLREDFGGTKRGDNATAIGRLGNAGDDGGHLVGHRFMGDTDDFGISPQAGNLNRGAWKTMENEWADWIKKGYEIDYDIKTFPPGAVRPDSFKSTYRVIDPKTGEVKYRNKAEMQNQSGEKFKRIQFRDME